MLLDENPYEDDARAACTIVTRARPSFALATAALQQMKGHQFTMVVSNQPDYRDLVPQAWEETRVVLFPELLRNAMLGCEDPEVNRTAAAIIKAGHRLVFSPRFLRPAFPSRLAFEEAERRSFRSLLAMLFVDIDFGAANLALAADCSVCSEVVRRTPLAVELVREASNRLGHLYIPRCRITDTEFVLHVDALKKIVQ